MGERLRWFGRVDDNNEIVKKIDETRVDGHRRIDRPKNRVDGGY